MGPEPRRSGLLGGRRASTFTLSLAIPCVATVSLFSWLLTAPAELRRTGPSEAVSTARSSGAEVVASEPAPEPLAWPVSSLTGDGAKRLLLDCLIEAEANLKDRTGYAATFRKRERLRGQLGPMRTMRIKVRHEPFAVYLKFLGPDAGKEVVYADGFNDNCLIGHDAGLTRLLVPRVKLDPTGPIAMRDNRHPITDIGLANLTTRLVAFRRLDLTDTNASTVLDWFTDEEGRRWPRSTHAHAHQGPDRPFARVELLYHPESFIPRQITSYDWPAEGHEGPLELAEHYQYDDVDFDAKLTDQDFDPANPLYAFTRF